MHSLFSMRPYRILTILIPLTILIGCGEGEGQARILNEPADPFAGPPASCFQALTFEDVCDQQIGFPDFEGGSGRVVDNPDISGGNPSGKVVEMVKRRANSGATFGGVVVDFSALGPVQVPAGSTVTVKVWSQRPVNLLFEPDTAGQIQGAGEEVAHGGTGWEELTFTLNASGSVTGRDISGWVFIFDNGTLGDFNNDPVNWTFYVDDISAPMTEGDGGDPGDGGFPITFDEATPPAVTEFGGAGIAIEPGPAGGDGNALKILRDGGDVFAGAWVAIPEIPNDQGDQTISALVFSPLAGIPMIAKAEFGENMGTGDVAANEPVVAGWQTLTWTFTNLEAPNVYNRFTILPNLGVVDSGVSYYFDNIDLVGAGGPGGDALGPIDFEPGGLGADFTWTIFENGDNPPLEVIANPDATGANTSATVAQFTARQAGQTFAGTVSADLPTFTLDASNAVVKVLVWKSVISDVGIKFENAAGGSTGEIKVANTVVNQWEELTFDFSGVIGDPVNTDITNLVIFPDFDARAQDNVIYFDNITFSDGSGGGTGGTGAEVDFETAGTGAGFTWNVFENGDNPPLEIIANPDATGANTTATVAQFTARQAGQPFAGTITNDLPTFTLDASNAIVKILVWKPEISDVGIKFENGSGGSTGEIKVANTVINQWEELTFDFSGVIGDPNNTDITGLVIFPDFNARAQDNVIYFDEISFSAAGGGGGSASVDFETGSATFNDFEGGVATVIANPDVSGINTSAQVGQMEKFAGQPFAGSTLDLGGAVPFAAGDSYTMKVRASREVVVTMKLEPLNEETTATHSGSGTWEELCFDFTGVSGDVTGITLIFDNGTVGDAENDPDNWTFQFDDIQQTSDACPSGGGDALGPIDFEPMGLGGAFAWTVFENGDNPPLEIIANPDATGANTSATVAKFTARQTGQPFAGTITSDLQTFTLDASNAIVKILVWKPEISDVGIKFETASGGSAGEIKVANTLINQWEELTFDFSAQIGDPNTVDITGLVIFPDFNARAQENVIYFDEISFSAVPAPAGLGPVDFEPGGQGAAFTWNVFENGDNPPLEIIANPDATGANTSATVAKFTARQAGQPFAGTITSDLPTFTLDASNAIVKILVWKPEISDVGIKFENGAGGSTGEIKVANTLINQWEELTFDFSGVIGDPNNTDITGLVIFPDFNARAQENVIYFDNITFSAVPAAGLGPVDFEPGGQGAAFAWTVFENGDNPPLEIIANPDATGANTSATVAKFTARQAGQPFAGTVTGDLPTFTLDASNAIVKILVWKPEISDVGIKFENGSGGSTGEIKVANTIINQWEELTFDFSGVIGDPNNTDITGLVIFPDFNARAQENVIYFDNIAFEAVPAAGGLGPVDFETAGTGAGFTWNVFENGDNPPLEIIANPDATGANTTATVAKFTARQAGQPFAGTITADLPTFTLDASNAIVKILVWKPEISDVGIKFENGSGGSTGEIKVANTLINQWEELTFDFSGVIGDPNNTDITGLVIFPDFNARAQENIIYFDEITFSAAGAGGGGGGGSAAVDFETGGAGAAFAWSVFENVDNPPLEIIANPDATGANTSATVAKFTARVGGQPFAGTITSDLPTFTLDASNAIVKILVWKPVISDVGIKFENGSAGSTGEIKVPNTVTNQWEELTFDFSGVIGDPNNTDITGLIIFPDFDARTQENIVYFDDVSFSAVGGGG